MQNSNEMVNRMSWLLSASEEELVKVDEIRGTGTGEIRPKGFRLLNLGDVCKALGCSRPTLRNAIKLGKVRTVDLGTCRKISSVELDRVMSGQPLSG